MFYLVKKYLVSTEQNPLEHIKIRETTKKYLTDKNLYNIFSVQLLLQLFYSYMTIYTPLYLVKYMGFSWQEIGLMFSIMLLPFILFEIPVGDLADKKYGEKEFLSIGLLIMGMATMFISFVTMKNFWVWATILFITRIGASFVEVSSDSYFFKKVDQSKADVISFYRLTRPLSYVVAPLIAAICLQFIPFEYTFIVIGAILIIGTRYSLALEDTK
jgi:MFS family permease